MEQNNYLQSLASSNRPHNGHISNNQFASLSYFNRYISLVSEKECRNRAQKCQRYFKLAKMKKGTVIYACEDIAQKGYILLSGCVQLLNKKNSREKTEMFPGHILHNQQERETYLFENYKIPKNKAEGLMNVFYEDKILFKYIPFHRLYNKQQFGFGEMMRNTSRIQTAVTLEDCELLVINKKDFDEHLRQFHHKKQVGLVSRILQGLKSQLVEELQPKMMQILNTSALYEYSNEDTIYTQNEYVSNLFFIIEGQVQIRKKAILTIPKKYMKHDSKQPIQKQATIKVCRTGKGQFIGQEQIFSIRKSRNFTVVSTSNQTLILKIDHTAFLKILNDFPDYQKQLIQNAVFKKMNADQSYERLYKKIFNSFISQYEAYDSKKKQKLLSDFMREDEKKKHKMFEVFAPQGVFYRDTFQKLEGFEEASKSPSRNQSIKRYKKKNNTMYSSSSPTKKKELAIQTAPEKNNEKQVIQKILFSPKRSINFAEFYSQQVSKQNTSRAMTPYKTQKLDKKSNSVVHARQHKQISKFQQMQKDEAIYKRVLIKNGAFPIDRKIDKSKSVKALVHHNFDEVVKLCVSRKNQAMRRSTKQQQNQIVLESYQRTLQNLKTSPLTNTSFKLSIFSAPCRGVEELKKKMKSIHNFGSERVNQFAVTFKKPEQRKIQDCIGINQKPKSSQIPHRDKLDEGWTKLSRNRTPQKIVFLNHMMKPITYFNSTQL